MADLKYLELLSKDYPNIRAAAAEYINLQAILALPKGTEYFLSDLHGEHEAFIHMIKSASGTIKSKIDEHYGGILSEEDRDDLAALIYNPEAEIKRRKKSEGDFDKWCVNVIYRLVTICKSVSTKYTRSKVRRRLPRYLDYAMDELLHADDEENRAHYYSEIINTIVYSGMAETFICEMAEATSRLAVSWMPRRMPNAWYGRAKKSCSWALPRAWARSCCAARSKVWKAEMPPIRDRFRLTSWVACPCVTWIDCRPPWTLWTCTLRSLIPRPSPHGGETLAGMANLDLALLGLARLTGLSLAETESLPLPRFNRLLHTLARARKS